MFYVDGQPLTVTVADAAATPTEWLTGVSVDGVDVSHVQAKGHKWYYDYDNKTLYVVDDCVVSGANTAGDVRIIADKSELSFTISNLHLRASSSGKSPIAVTNGTVTVRLAGSNTLDASETDSYAGLNVVPPATLVITNLEESASLLARSGEDAAAIGGNQSKQSYVNPSTGTIRIEGGRIRAEAKDTKIELEDMQFNNIFDVYSPVQQDAVYLITPHMMERMQVLAGKYESIAMKVVGNRVVLAFNEPGKNVFDQNIDVGKLDIDQEMAKVQGEIDDIKIFISTILNLRPYV